MLNDPVTGTPTSWSELFVAHHWPSQHDRCVTIAGRAVCRRCIILWPATLVVYVIAATVIPSPVPAGVWIVGAALSAPAIIDFLGELFGKLGASPRRLVLLTVPLSVGLGLLAAATTISTLL